MAIIELLSVVFITLALIFYTLGVWAERSVKYLKTWHVLVFWTGFIFDISGTVFMHLMAKDPFNLMEPHTLTGQIALWLMFAHAGWASIVIRKNRENLRQKFHRYSLFVWLVWLVPYFGGMIMAMK